MAIYDQFLNSFYCQIVCKSLPKRLPRNIYYSIYYGMTKKALTRNLVSAYFYWRPRDDSNVRPLP